MVAAVELATDHGRPTDRVAGALHESFWCFLIPIKRLFAQLYNKVLAVHHKRIGPQPLGN